MALAPSSVYQKVQTPSTKIVNVNSDKATEHWHINQTVLLETGHVTLKNEERSVMAGLMMDRGSMSSYIRREIAQKLNLRSKGAQSLYVNGFGGHSSKRVNQIVDVIIKTSDGDKVIDALVTDEIVKPIRQQGWGACLDCDYRAEHETNLANNFTEDPFIVDIMIGCDHAFEFLENRIIKGDGPTVQFSNLGCFVSGRLKPQKSRTVLTACNTENNAMDCFREDSQIDHLENVLRANVLSDTGMTDMDYEDNYKEKYMERIQFRDGHYYVPLPWRPDHPELQNNYNTCKGRINEVMHRLRKLNLVHAYVNVMKENISKGYVSEVTTAPTSRLDEEFFLPHFPVLRDSETTPLRIVFDASCGSPSLNSCLYEGPNMIQDLTELLHLFRTKKIAISADIVRAFLSVRLFESERKFVNFLWYKDNDVTKGLVPYHCNTVIFGNVTSPFALAITLHKHLSAFDGKVAEDMKEKLYVDNLLTGVTDEAEALEYYTQSRDIMNKGSFLLRQWSSNSPKLSAVAESDGSNAKSEEVSVLGLKWHPEKDTLSIERKIKEQPRSKVNTKRTVTSESASVFDPLGFLGPLHVPAKSFVNQLWQAGKDWDDKLPWPKMNNGV
ncbi:uncharacterized protein LOC135500858 [Lineus longissimus]|uniref:uncharacterized protein LOC135500858 n=1 Tax=Lineus longissimus TaxID=88925 RepID=UPI00315CDBAE